MIYNENLNGIWGVILSEGLNFATNTNEQNQQAYQSDKDLTKAKTDLYLRQYAESNKPEDTSWKSSALNIQKYGAIAAIGIVVVIGFFALKK
jgi:hypothetical protein